ncbi:cyclic nucleotide-binding domain-containing protein [Nocardioides sp.]|uniref:cyclic nucleotide-binding domain-containing protein n=1 Tax=Nocardioides sp. TaxID=35761 RepID=UPI002733121B|nr:cyclic nucleotide-binding domain-containing protein [Nocardioides sp.]MDP3894665.1 cyclic nucleotide-binding domain-containing protein [Nocardioides sp.]
MSNRSTDHPTQVSRADRRELITTLRELGVFPDADDHELRTIVDSGRLVSVPAGWSLIWERTPADKAYVVLRGELDVRHDDQVVAHLGAGDIIGEMAIVNRRLRSATVVAATALKVLHFTREAVEELHATVPGFRAAVDAAAAAHAS